MAHIKEKRLEAARRVVECIVSEASDMAQGVSYRIDPRERMLDDCTALFAVKAGTGRNAVSVRGLAAGLGAQGYGSEDQRMSRIAYQVLGRGGWTLWDSAAEGRAAILLALRLGIDRIVILTNIKWEQPVRAALSDVISAEQTQWTRTSKEFAPGSYPEMRPGVYPAPQIPSRTYLSAWEVQLAGPRLPSVFAG